MATLFAPVDALLGRMSYARKIVLIAVVMVLPLGIVPWGYTADQAGQIGFSALERDGVAYLRPLVEVDIRCVDARDRAVRGGNVASGRLDEAMTQVDAVNAALGGELGASDGWRQTRAALAAAGAAADRSAALTAW